MSHPEASEPIDLVVSAYADANDSDILLIVSGMDGDLDRRVIDLCRSRNRRKNITLVLVTLGGDPRVAFRIARCLQANYESMSVVLGGLCKSAGTLLATAAHRLVMDEHAELGPLDIQVLKDDGFGERTSGLTPGQALLSLDARARVAFRNLFIELKTGAMMTTRTAADVASSMVSSLYGGIYSQVDPMRLGELQRAQMIGSHYAERLAEHGKNVKDGGISQLTNAYPDHGFVIDRREAAEIFNCVDEPTEHERKLLSTLEFVLRLPYRAEPNECHFLNPEPENHAKEPEVSSATESGHNGLTEIQSPEG